jgi:two-component system cell cycle response regulator
MVSCRPILIVPLLASAAWLLVYGLDVVAFGGAHLGPFSSRFAHDVVLAVTAGVCLARGVLVRRERAAWLLIGAGVAAWVSGELYYTLVLWDDPSPPIPSPADAGFLLFPPLVFTGMFVLLRGRAAMRPALLVDGIAAACAVSALSAAIVFEAVLEHADGDPLAVATSLAYPASDLILLAVGVGALAATGWHLDRTWALLAAGILVFWLADSMYLVRTAEGVYEAGGWFDLGWWTGLLLVAVAAWHRPPAERRLPADGSLRLIIAPLIAGAVALELLVYASLDELNPLAIALAAASAVFVMIRMVLTFRQNVAMLQATRDEALTDALTGLGNRRALTQALDTAVASGVPYQLALFDLDGFKHYNDTFGHPAGDVLLSRLGASLAAFVGDRGGAFRMGGDEFCVLLESADANLVEGAARTLSVEGEGYWIGCSYGAIALPEEAADADAALRLADQRMYASKHAGRMSAARQARDVLLAVLGPRDRAPAEWAEVRYAVELHALGEDVLAAAPSLAAVARLVVESRAPRSPAARIVAAAVPVVA